LRGGAQGSAAPRKMARKRRRKSEGNGHAAMHFAVSNNGPAVKATIKAWRGIAGTQTEMKTTKHAKPEVLEASKKKKRIWTRTYSCPYGRV